MDNLLYELFKKIPDHPAPGALHAMTMRRMLFARVQRLVWFVALIAALSFAFSLWHLYVRMVELDFVSVAQTLISTLDLDLDSITEASRTLADFTPIGAAMVSFLNFIALGFALYLVRTFKRVQTMY